MFPASFGIISVALPNVAVAPVFGVCLTSMVPPWVTSTSVEALKRSLINWSEIGSTVNPLGSSGTAVFPIALNVKEDVFLLNLFKALYDFTKNLYVPNSDSNNSKVGLDNLTTFKFSFPLLNPNKYSFTPCIGSQDTNIFDTARLLRATICSEAVKLLGAGFVSRIVVIFLAWGISKFSTKSYLSGAWNKAVIVYWQSFFSSMDITLKICNFTEGLSIT